MKKILVIEDESVNQAFITLALEHSELDFEIVIARDGFQGVNKFSEAHYDLVLLDYAMPDMDGVEVFHELKQINPNVKVIGITAYMDCKEFRDLLQQGMLLLLEKPMNFRPFLNAVESHL